MAFLDNSGDIILDAVLTDTGRMRLAKGDGSFRIAKFALGDTEINYELYDTGHASGSAYYDLQVLQTPVLEAFTNNAASMSTKLISIPRNNIFYLPVMKLFEGDGTGDTARHTTTNTFCLAVNEDTQTSIASLAGVLSGETDTYSSSRVEVHQGLDTSAISPSRHIDPFFREIIWKVQIDNRLASPISINGLSASPSYVDDDNIATYFFTAGTDVDFIQNFTDTSAGTGASSIQGPRGNYFFFKLAASLETNTSDYLFTTLGATKSLNNAASVSTSYKTIESTIRIEGGSTGASLDIPFTLLKL